MLLLSSLLPLLQQLVIPPHSLLSDETLYFHQFLGWGLRFGVT